MSTSEPESGPDIAALRESEVRSRELIEGIAPVFWEADPEGVVVADSPSWRACTGQTVEEWLGYGWLNAVHPDDREHAERSWRQAVTAQRLVDAEFRIRTRDGGYRWTNVRAAPLVEQEIGAVRKWVCMNIDIDDRKRTEIALRESEQKLRQREAELAQVQRVGGVGGVTIDIDGGLTGRRSPEYRRLHGLPDSVQEEQHEDWLRRVHPDDRQRANEALQTAISSRDANYENEYRIIRPSDGEVRWIFAKADIVRDESGQAIRMIGAHIDITERKAAEQALRESEENYRALFDSIDEGFCTIQVLFNEQGQAVDYRFVQVNPSFERQTGLVGTVGKRMRELVPDHDDHWFEIYGRVALTGESVRFQEEAKALGRSYDVYAFRVGPPELRHVAVLFNDVTEQRRAEATLRESEQRLAAIFERAEVGISEISADGKFVRVNETLCRILGRTREELLGMGATDITHPDDVACTVEAFGPVLETGEPTSVDKRYVRPDGSVVWANSRLSRLEKAAGPATVLVVTTDLTARREAEAALRSSEERLRLIVENAADYAIFSLDLDRHVTSWNTGAERMLGWPEAEILGHLADVIFTEEDRANGVPEKEAETALRTGRASDERWHVRKNGERFWANGVMTVIRNPEGNVIGLAKIFRDETEARRARQELESSREQLIEALQENEQARAEIEAASAAKDRFLALLSHELRTPLSPVLLTLKMLARNKQMPESALEKIELIRRNVQLEALLIDDLLDITRIESGKMEVVRQPMDFHEAVLRALEVSAEDIEARKQKLTITLGAAQHRLEGDAPRLQQVAWNLVKNASKFTPEGGDICVSTENQDGKVILSVTDAGIGIRAEILETIFRAFAQGDPVVTGKFGGLGLGLAISRAIVESHRGTIRAESEGEGHGATFIVELPLPENPAFS